MSINWLDIVILIMILGTFALGCFNGIIKSLTVLVGLGLGIFLSGRTYETTASWFYFIRDERWAQVAGFAAVLILVIVAVSIVGIIINKMLEKLEIRWVDRLIGGLVFAISAMLLIGTILTLFLHIQPESSVIANSLCAKLILQVIPLVVVLLPDNLRIVKDFFII